MSHLRPGASSHSSPGQGHSAPRNANINPPKRARGIGTSTRTLACSDMPGMPHVVPHIFAGSGWSPPGRLGYAQPRTCLGPRRHFARSRHGEGTRRSSHPSCLCLPCSGWPPRCSGACPATGSGPCLAAAETCTCERSAQGCPDPRCLFMQTAQTASRVPCRLGATLLARSLYSCVLAGGHRARL